MARKIYAEIPVRAPAERIFQALLDSDELRAWFVEDADVSVDDDRYAFWGRYQPDAPARNEAGQRILAMVPDGRLRFDWRVFGIETTVDIQIEERAAATKVTVEHEWLPEEIAPVIEAFWSLSLENLRGWVERGVVGARCDFTVKPLEEVRLSIDIDAEPDEVFRALVEPEQMNRYMAGDASVDPRVGGYVDLGWGDHKAMKILDIQPGERLAYTWNYEGDRDAMDTLVTWTLEGSAGRTRLTLVHSGFSAKRGAEDYQIGWLDFLNRIKFMVEVGPTWAKPNTHGMHREDEPIDEAVYARTG